MARRRQRQRGSIEELPSGALRVRVYAGVDAVTGREHYLREIVAAGPKKWDEAEAVRTRLLNEINERRHPRTVATVQQLLDHHLPLMHVAETTRRNYERYVRKHVIPLIGHVKIGALDADLLDSFYAELLRCREHCTDRRHECTPLAAWTVRKIHFVLSSAYERAVRWHWIGKNPMTQADPPAAPAPNPTPPTPDEAARILNEAWQDLDFGTLVWTVMTTAPRRGEICALRWRHFDAERAVLKYAGSIAQDGAQVWENDTKGGSSRNVALDETTVAVLADYRKACEERAVEFGLTLGPDWYIFSPAPDGSAPLKPTTVGQRYNRIASRLGVKTSIHKLRHYSATELIAGGVDIRTVAGRLGHSGGGTTTRKVYAAWVTEADQRASKTLMSRVPERPPAPLDPAERAKVDPQAPYEHIAVALRAQILEGELTEGEHLPSIKSLAAAHEVTESTAHRAIGLLKTWNLVTASRGSRTVVTYRPEPPQLTVVPPAPDPAPSQREALDLEVIHRGKTIRTLRAEADPNNTDELRQLLTDAIKRTGADESTISEYEMNVHYAGERAALLTFAASDRHDRHDDRKANRIV